MKFNLLEIMQDKKKKMVILIGLFLVFFIFGLFSYKDYGISTDELVQRQHGLVNLKYVCQIIDENNIPEYLADIPMNLYDYGTMMYYGIGIKIPLIIFEYLNGFKLSNQQIFHMNHLYTFLLFFVASIYVYKLLSILGFNFLYSLLGTILFMIYPRTLADSFYNIKDSIFLSLFVIMLYYGIAFIKKFNWQNSIGLIISAAFCLNTRIIGCFPLLFIIIFYIFQEKVDIRKRIFRTILIGLLSFSLYILITPAFWIEGIGFIFNVGKVFSDYTYGGPYLGNSVKLPWYYLLVSIVITLPSSYVILFFVGWLVNAKKIISTSIKENYFCTLVFLQFTAIIIYDMIMKPIKYNMWRHFYFLLIYIVIFILYGIQYFIRKLYQYKIYIQMGIGFSIFLIILWIIKYHPYEYVYLNPVLSAFVDDAELDYWQVAYQNVMKAIEKDDNIVVYEQGGVQTLYFGEEGWEKFHASKDIYGAEYVLSSVEVKPNILYDIINELTIDGKVINTLQKRKNYDNCILKYYFTDKKEIIGENARDEIEWEYFERGVEKGFNFYISESYEVYQIDFWAKDLDSIASVCVYVSENGSEWSTYDSTSVFCSKDLFSIISNKKIGPYVQIVFETITPVTITEFDINVYGNDIAQLDYVISNYNQEDIQLLCDGDKSSRWSSNALMEEGMYIEFGLKSKKRISGITLSLGTSIYDFPSSVCIQGKNNMGEWEDIEYLCLNNENFVFDVPVEYTSYRIINQKAAPHWWSVHELIVHCANKDVWWNNIDTVRTIAALESSYNSNCVSEMLDNSRKTKWHSGATQCEDMFIKIELQDNENVAGFHLGAGTRFEMPRVCQILGSYDGEKYENIIFYYGDSYDYIFEQECSYKYYMIKQIGSDDFYEWSIAELGILR